MPVRALVAAAGVLGFTDNSVRVALARLLASGHVERDERGAYRLGGSASFVQSYVSGWRRRESTTRPWRGDWIAAFTEAAPRGDRPLTRRRARAFQLAGLRPLEPNLWLRPANLREGAGGLRSRLQSADAAGGVLVGELHELDADAATRAGALWDADALTDGYRQAVGELDRSARRLDGMDEAAAMAESFTVGGRVLRRIINDPLLPDPIVPTELRRTMTDAMRASDKLGRARWAAFMTRHGCPAMRLPTDRRIGTASATWAATFEGGTTT